MEELILRMQTADLDEVYDVLKAARIRFSQLYPTWYLTTITVDKEKDRREQIDSVIRILETANRMLTDEEIDDYLSNETGDRPDPESN